MFGFKTNQKNPITSNKVSKRKTALQHLARHRHAQIGFVALSAILVITGVVVVQKVQIYKSEAADSCRARCGCLSPSSIVSIPLAVAGDRYIARCTSDCINNCKNLKTYLKRAAAAGDTGGSTTPSTSDGSGSTQPSHQDRVNFWNWIARQGSRTQSPSSNTTSRANAHTESSLVLPTPIPNCTPIRTAPVLTSPNRNSFSVSGSGALEVSPGTHAIKWRVAAGQKGGVVVIDDKSSPSSSSCNHLNSGDACRVPESKGRNNQLDFNFRRGKRYSIRVTTVNCGTASTASSELKIVVVSPSVTPIPSGVVATPGLSTTISPTPTP